MVLEQADSCTEETLLYYLVSGLHASVNTHISTGFIDPVTQEQTSNQTYFLEKVGNHKDRVKNLHFIYAAVIKAISAMEPALLNADYKTGLDKKADKDTELLIRDLIRKISTGRCDRAFKANELFDSDQKEATKLKLIGDI